MVEKAVDGRMEVVAYDTRVGTCPPDRAVREADAVILSNFPYRREVTEHCPNLKYINVAFTGGPCGSRLLPERGSPCPTVPAIRTAAVADLVFGMVIALGRNLGTCDEVVRQGADQERTGGL